MLGTKNDVQSRICNIFRISNSFKVDNHICTLRIRPGIGDTYANPGSKSRSRLIWHQKWSPSRNGGLWSSSWRLAASNSDIVSLWFCVNRIPSMVGVLAMLFLIGWIWGRRRLTQEYAGAVCRYASVDSCAFLVLFLAMRRFPLVFDSMAHRPRRRSSNN